MAGIPVTHRNSASGFRVVSATTKGGSLNPELDPSGTQDQTTLIVLMGLNKLKEISELYTMAGRDMTPVAVIQDGTLPGQKLAVGTMENILKEVEEKEIEPPAVIVIGESVKSATPVTENLNSE
jgi:uroporphyrin-III C-methyltransferase